MLCGKYKTAEDSQLILILHQNGNIKKTLLCLLRKGSLLGHITYGSSVKDCSTGAVTVTTVTKLTPAFRSMGQMSQSRVTLMLIH